MAQDYPDYMQNVSRAPIQSDPYETFGVLNNSQAAPANTLDYYTWNLPNNGLFYVIDTIFFVYLDLGPFVCNVYQCANQGSPSWILIGGDIKELKSEIVPSKQGALKMQYPMALKFEFDNLRNQTVTWGICCTYYTVTE